ncbi:MAG: lactonase family protein [Verrucomicrobiota bacterium]|nr:lactonase family protein [Verrucomicrobiota bacterium]
MIDTGTDSLIGDFATGTYAEKALFDSTGTRLYITDRSRDEVRAFRVEAGPKFTRIAEIATGNTELERANPRDLDLSADGNTLYVANTMGHTIAAIKNNGQPLCYTPVMSEATTFDDIGSELNIFDTQTNLFVYRYVDKGRDYSQLVTPGQIVDLHDHTDAQKLIRGSGPEQMMIRNGLLFVTMLHSDKVEVFRVNPNPADVSQILSPAGFEFTGGITPEGIEVSADGRTAFVANLQTEDISFLGVDQNGNLTRQGYLAVGVTPSTPDPVKGGHGSGLFATDEEVGLRWFFSSAYAG